MGAQITNQRIGDRIPVYVDGVEWQPVAPRRSLFKRPRLTARVVEVSVSGAGILAPAEPHVPLGQIVTIVLNDRAGTVHVRRRERTTDPATLRYGVEFVSLDNPLAELAKALLAEVRPAPTFFWDETRLNRALSAE